MHGIYGYLLLNEFEGFDSFKIRYEIIAPFFSSCYNFGWQTGHDSDVKAERLRTFAAHKLVEKVNLKLILWVLLVLHEIAWSHCSEIL